MSITLNCSTAQYDSIKVTKLEPTNVILSIEDATKLSNALVCMIVDAE